MNITMILEMAASAGDRPAVTADGRSLTPAELLRLARAAAGRFRGHPAVLYQGTSHLAYPVALFGAAVAGVPLIPLNYRPGGHQLDALVNRHPGALVIRPSDLEGLLEPAEPPVPGGEPAPEDGDPAAVLLYTSGTTADPKAAVLRHRHLLAYVLNTVEFGSAGEQDAALVAVPPYHVAGLANLLTSLYAGRRVVYLATFDAGEWLETVRRERITHAMLVPTMLARIVAQVPGDDAGTPTLRSLAYGLTETASSIAVLSPDDHRAALTSSDPAVRDRLGSVGRALPGVEFQIRADDGEPAAAGESGLVFVRGEQISGEYSGQSSLDSDGWFATRDRGRLDADGYLFIEGRADDTIIRGGENIAPAEVEDVLLAHPQIAEAAVIGVPDPEWGQRRDAAEIRQWVRDRLRSSKTPDEIVFRDELPRTDNGKLLRRVLLAELETA